MTRSEANKIHKHLRVSDIKLMLDSARDDQSINWNSRSRSTGARSYRSALSFYDDFIASIGDTLRPSDRPTVVYALIDFGGYLPKSIYDRMNKRDNPNYSLF